MAGSSHHYGSQLKKFKPPTRAWQISTGRMLNIKVEYYMRYGTSKYFNETSGPKMTASVEADGNCFFRALSVLITGVEDNHMNIREQITRHVEKHSDIYRTFLQSRGGMDMYVRSMRRPREWATDTEIFAAATFLKTIIEVCSVKQTRRSTVFQWQTFTPLNDNDKNLPRVYISHNCEHFEPVLDVTEATNTR